MTSPDNADLSLTRLHGGVQNYAWGSTSLLPEFLGRPADGKPHAELWLGSHPTMPATVDGRSLLDLIETDPVRLLGEGCERTSNRLPYLLKVLAVAQPLSIQVHPNLAQAAEGFAREEREGVGQSSPTRSYKDANHKPELICALTDFELLCGFVSNEQISRRLGALQEIVGDLGLSVGTGDHASRSALFRDIFALPLENMASVVDAAVEVAEQVGMLALRKIASHYSTDRGVVVALLMNHVTLEPGQAMYFDAGITHAYLTGLGVEILANSDNVIRAGLTPKHIDVDELIKIFDPLSGQPSLVSPHIIGDHATWPTPCEDFELQRIRFGQEMFDGWITPSADRGPRIALCTAGAVSVMANGKLIRIGKGESAWVGPSVHASFRASGPAPVNEVFLARGPVFSDR